MAGLRAAARQLAYAGGLLGLRHALRHRDTLTVATFHSVMEAGTEAAARLDPCYTISAELFAACLGFFRRHYTVVSLEQVRASVAGGPPLPPYALLITFDDGWQDNVSVAAPILRAQGLPAVVFVAADILAEPEPWWWQEILLRAWRDGRASFDELWALAGGGAVPPGVPELVLLIRYGGLSAATRTRLLAPFADNAIAEGRHMIGPDGLQELVTAGIDLGGHGATHLPLSMLADPAADLARARAVLEPPLQALGQTLDTMSFPHGRYDAASLAAARALGFPLLFTSDACLNAAPAGRPASLLGRIPVDAAMVVDEAGVFAPSRLATCLFHRPLQRLTA